MIALLAFTAMAQAQQPKYTMVTWQLVVLKDGPDKTPVSAEAGAKMQRDHLGNLKWLMDKGYAAALGPLEGEGDWRGLVLMKVQSSDEAKALMADDPYVKAGKMAIEVYPWFFGKYDGLFDQRSAGFLDIEPHKIVFLMRPANAPTVTKEEGEKLQSGHMANIQAMADTGWLAAAGPMAVDTPFRGIFLFRTNDEKLVRKLMAPDPAIKRGRLAPRVMTWYVAKGLIPPKQ